MDTHLRLREDRRTHRRTIADALEVEREEQIGAGTTPAHVQIASFSIPSGQRTALVDVVFPGLGCRVSLPTSSQFKARTDTSRRQFEIARLDGGEIGEDGSVLLREGMRVWAVEVIPTFLPYQQSELEKRIVEHVITLTRSAHCIRRLRDELPPDLREQVPDVGWIDYAQVVTIQAPQLKVIKAYIEDHDPQLKVSNQKIADALARSGTRVPVARPRATRSP